MAKSTLTTLVETALVNRLTEVVPGALKKSQLTKIAKQISKADQDLKKAYSTLNNLLGEVKSLEDDEVIAHQRAAKAGANVKRYNNNFQTEVIMHLYNFRASIQKGAMYRIRETRNGISDLADGIRNLQQSIGK